MGGAVIALVDSPVLDLVRAVHDAGVRLRLGADGRILANPVDRLTDDQRTQLRTCRVEVVELLRSYDLETDHRVQVFQGQLADPPEGVILPLLVYRPDLPYVEGFCYSCGDLLEDFRFGRCWRCALAFRLALRLPVSPELVAALDEARIA